jgi:hypothetical protein
VCELDGPIPILSMSKTLMASMETSVLLASNVQESRNWKQRE